MATVLSYSYFSYLTILVTSNKNSQVVDGDRGDLAEIEKKT